LGIDTNRRQRLSVQEGRWGDKKVRKGPGWRAEEIQGGKGTLHAESRGGRGEKNEGPFLHN